MTSTLIKSSLAVGLAFAMSIVSSTAGAWVSSGSTSQTSCTTLQIKLGQCSIKSEGLLKGLGNTTNYPTAYTVSLLIQAGYFVMKNPAGNSKQASGTPFQELLVEVTESDLIDADQISRNGRATADVVFHDAVLLAVILPALEVKCGQGDENACEVFKQIDLHPNWLQTVVVTKLQVLGIQYVDDSDACSITTITTGPGPDGQIGTDDDTTSTTISGTCTLEDALGQTCNAPAAVLADPKAFAWKEFNYSCTEQCHDRTGTSCAPYNLPF